ncbi:MAG: UDP-N-acetylglucosamine--N-acetylmuramyl-(pentapeptide) pyrophosphoryl-undecaprenol N-acetylglucosamine transferase, partial [Candidatus Delongbacteria bacterium]
GGGTGGHVYPTLAIAEQIKKNEPDAEFLYLGTKDHIEAKIVPAKGYKMKYIRSTGMPAKKVSLSMLKFMLSVLAGTLKSIFIVLSYKPDMIIGSGGFVSAPPIFAGHILRKLKLSKTKMFLHEANAEAGKLVKFAGPMCDGVGVSYRVSLKDFPTNGKYVGYPVRAEFFDGSKEKSRKKLDINPEKFVVFSVGGSQGARTINRALADSLKYLKEQKDLLIIHVTGHGSPGYNAELDTIKRLEKNGVSGDEYSFYKRMPYADPIKDYYFASDIVITRGGGSLNEIAVCKKPSLIIPKANLSGDHQVMNALNMKNSGSAEIIYEEVMAEGEKLVIKVEGIKIADALKDLLSDKKRLAEMSECANNSVLINANKEIYGFIRSIFEKKSFTSVSVEPKQHNPFAEMTVFQIYSRLLKMSREEVDNNWHLDYINYRASHFLISPCWNVQNTAVKIVGLTADRTKIPFLSVLLTTNKIGFIRRNIMAAYKHIGTYNETVEKDIFRALQDKYWEVNVEGLKCIRYFRKDTSQNSKFKPYIINALRNGNHEVLINAINSYSIFVKDVKDLQVLQNYYYHNNCKVRETIISVLAELRDENQISADQFVFQIGSVLQTTVSFEPQFSMKKKLKESACL